MTGIDILSGIRLDLSGRIAIVCVFGLADVDIVKSVGVFDVFIIHLEVQIRKRGEKARVVEALSSLVRSQPSNPLLSSRYIYVWVMNRESEVHSRQPPPFLLLSTLPSPYLFPLPVSLSTAIVPLSLFSSSLSRNLAGSLI
jgi:hypothetical protein